MFATELQLGETTSDVRLVRWELFVFRDVRDVLPGARAGTVVVIHTGAARRDAWLAELCAAGVLPDRVRPRTRS